MKIVNLKRSLAKRLSVVAVAGGMSLGAASDGYAVVIPDAGFEDHVIDSVAGYAYGAASPPNTAGDSDGFNNASSANGLSSPWQALGNYGNGIQGSNASWIFNSTYGTPNSGDQAAEVQGIFAQNLTATFEAGEDYFATVAATADGGDDDLVVSLYDAGAVTFLSTSTPDLILTEPSLVTATPVLLGSGYADAKFAFTADSLAALVGKNIGIAIYSPDADGQGPWIDDVRLSTESPTLSVNQSTGEIKINNPTGTLSSVDMQNYSIVSAAGALDPTSWTSIAGNYDNGGAVSADPWTVLTNTTTPTFGDLSEAQFGGSGGSIAEGTEVSLGLVWAKSPFKDITFEYRDTVGNKNTLPIVYLGDDIAFGDFDFDGNIDGDDWNIFIGFSGTVIPATTAAQSYVYGDLNGDLENNFEDFRLFETAYDDANGPGAFQAMLASVPEPSSLVLLSLAGVMIIGRNRRSTC